MNVDWIMKIVLTFVLVVGVNLRGLILVCSTPKALFSRWRNFREVANLAELKDEGKTKS